MPADRVPEAGADDRPRWPGDERGQGIGPGMALGPAVTRLVADLGDPAWRAEDPVAHLTGKLEAWIDDHPAGPWADLELADRDPWLELTATWRRADGRQRDLRADAYALLGAIAEEHTFVVQRREPDVFVFEAATGQHADGFRPHGHLVRLVPRGHDADRVVRAADAPAADARGS